MKTKTLFTITSLASFSGKIGLISAVLLTACPLYAERVAMTEKASVSLDTVLAGATGRQAAVIAPTGSMLPVIAPTHVAVVEPRAFKDLKAGDIVVFTDGVQTVSHRIKAKYRAGCVTKGDANKSVDPQMMTSRNYLGFVVVAVVDRDSGDVAWL